MTGNVLMFLDADTIVPPTLFVTIAAVMADPRCSGGAVAVDYGPFARKWMKWYLRGWAFWGRLVLTHPLVILFNWKRRSVWRDWYQRPIR